MTRTTPPTSSVGVPGCSADGRRWQLRTTPTSVAAITSAGTVAEAHVSERAGRLIIEFWADGPGLPAELSAHLVAQAFSLPAVGAHCPVLVCVPRRAGELLAHARRHVQGARTRAAGVTCMVEGRIGEHPPAPISPEAARQD
jgi:hypothetical protein